MENDTTAVLEEKRIAVPKSLVCNCCFKSDGTLYMYQIKTFALLTAFGDILNEAGPSESNANLLETESSKECNNPVTTTSALTDKVTKSEDYENMVNSLTLCYICKEAARQAEKFVLKVQNAQHLLQKDLTKESRQPNHSPLKILTKKTLDGTDINPEDPLNVLHLKKEDELESKCFYPTSTSYLEVKLEVEHENDSEREMQIKKEKTIPDSIFAVECNYKYNQQVHVETSTVDTESHVNKNVNSDFDDEEDDDDSDQPDDTEKKDVKKFGRKVIRVEITKEECLKERALKATDSRFVEAVYKCTPCIKWFSMKTLLDDHMEWHSNSRGDHECEICKRRLPSRKDLQRHMILHLVRYKCSECEYTATQHNYAMDHYTQIHSETPPHFPCARCGKSFPTLRGLKAHKTNMHKNESNRGVHKCEYCDIKPFATRAGLSYHLKHLHTDQVAAVIKRYSCPQCEKGFKTSTQVKAHLNTHRTSRDFYCVECDKYFKTKEAIYSHYMTNSVHINNTAVKYPCDQCEKRFGFKHLLRIHIQRDHEKVKNYRCERCEREFFSKASYLRHISLVHEKDPLAKLNQPRLPCAICEKTFSSKKNLDAHHRVHTGERPFKCAHCNADFSQSGSLHNHVKLVHLGLTRDGTPKGQNRRRTLKTDPDYRDDNVQI